ncbi:MAG: hypothetical protein ACPGU7_04360 [Gammaproteobacteria bacterium]
MACPTTDFHQDGLAGDPVVFGGRHVLFTFDVEGFRIEQIQGWLLVFRALAAQLHGVPLPFSFFLATEFMVQLRHRDAAVYAEFCAALHDLWAVGGRVHMHNHFVFDLATGLRLPPAVELPERYAKRRSLFHSVVYGQGIGMDEWLPTAYHCHEEIMADIGHPAHELRVFRVGGWDYGVSREDRVAYLKALAGCGVRIDTSAGYGEFGTPGFRIGSPFGCNTYRLAEDLVEVAPCWAWEAHSPPWHPRHGRAWKTLLGQSRLWTGAPGVFNVVMHLDHLLHDFDGRTLMPYAVTRPEDVERRVRSLLTFMRRLGVVLRLNPVHFDDLPCLSPAFS